MAVFITAITGDLKDILGLLFLFLLLAFTLYSQSCISFSYSGSSPFILSVIAFLLFFFPDLLRGLFRALFGLISFILSLRGYDFLVNLIISRIETYLQGLFCLRASLIQMDTFLNLSSDLSLVGCTH